MSRAPGGEEAVDPILFTGATLNPYRTAVGYVLSRLRWDLNPESWRSRARLRALRDSRVGERAVIVCNGPSLNRTDLSLLDGVFTFGMNKINLLFDRSDFRPSCIVSVNRLVIEQNRDFFNSTEIPLFLDAAARTAGLVPPRDEVTYLHPGPPGFARDCSVSLFQGYTVTYVCLQLAFHMGFSDVALVGCDHSFAASGPANAAVRAGEVDESHFDPRYFSGGMTWQLPDLAESEAAYARARRTFDAFGRRVVNATEGGKLELFERVTLDSFIRG